MSLNFILKKMQEFGHIKTGPLKVPGVGSYNLEQTNEKQ